MLEEPDLLLLDEPTNHLDVEATEHLEERLREWPKAFVLVSHDRYFLRAVCREIVELEAGKVVTYPCGYDKYVVERAERHERLNAAYERQEAEIASTEDFIRRNIAGQKTKQAKRGARCWRRWSACRGTRTSSPSPARSACASPSAITPAARRRSRPSTSTSATRARHRSSAT